MSCKMKNIPVSELKCEKYLNKMLRHEKAFATKRSPVPQYQEKLPNVMKQSFTINTQRLKTKVKQSSPQPTPVVISDTQRQRDNELSPLKEPLRAHKTRNRSSSRPRSQSRERESWGQLLYQHRSKDKTSTFSSFDPLRTVHFLSRELQSKLQNALPDEDEIHHMVHDIQQALKRIPPEISTFLHMHTDFPILSKLQEPEKLAKPTTSNKHCQTPPTLYQEDTEKFQKIMEENTYRLEASCKQLEIVCTNLQNEKEMTERELDEARDHIEILCKRVKELEVEMEEISNMKIKQLEEEKQELQRRLDKAMEEITDNPTINNLRKLVDELKKQKATSDEACARFEFDVTLLKMEKEKFATMLSLRDREVKEIQEEMAKIQDQVNRQLNKLNGEVLSKVNTVKTSSDPLLTLQGNRDIFTEMGDATISSITTNESEGDFVDVVKDSPCGDAKGLTQDQRDNFLQKLVQSNNAGSTGDKDHEAVLEELLKGMTPSCKALLNSAS